LPGRDCFVYGCGCFRLAGEGRINKQDSQVESCYDYSDFLKEWELQYKLVKNILAYLQN